MGKLLLLSPYDSLSHRFWREGLTRYLEGQVDGWQVVTRALPARHFSWRQRGNSLTYSLDKALQEDYDLLIATSMTDLSALKGMHRGISGVPSILYFHENQFSYPDQKGLGLVERQVTSIYSALAADRVFFNSIYNLETYLHGAEELLQRMPDGIPAGVVDRIKDKAAVVPVALEGEAVERNTFRSPLRIAWNHRWEHDKGPALLEQIVAGLLALEVEFEFGLFGQRFRQSPAEYLDVAARLEAAGRLRHAGFVEERGRYLDTLSEYDVVLSTASQEFQGLAIQEAMQLGCTPVVPDALCYPEYVPSSLRYTDAREAVDIICHLEGPTNPGLEDYRWDAVGPAWLSAMGALTSTRR